VRHLYTDDGGIFASRTARPEERGAGGDDRSRFS